MSVPTMDARKVIPIIDKHKEYQTLATQVFDLYTDISEKALQIDKSLKVKNVDKTHLLRREGE